MLRGTIAVVLLATPLAAGAADWSSAVDVSLGGTLEIDLDAGSIEVEVHSRDEVRADAFVHGLLGRRFEWQLEGDGQDAELTGKGGGWLFGGHVRVRVRVPQRYSIDASTRGGAIRIEALEGEVQAETSGGPIVVDGARGEVQLQTSGGPIEISSVRGDVEAHTSGGGIRVSDVEGSIDVETSGGPIRIYEVRGPVQARTSGGPITVRFAERAEGQLETSGGPIQAEIPSGVGVDLDAQTSGGRVRVEEGLELVGKIESDHIKASLNGGGPELRLKTSGGNVRIRVR